MTPAFWALPVESVRGVVVKSEATDALDGQPTRERRIDDDSDPKYQIFAIQYRFIPHDGVERRGLAYRTGAGGAGTVDVEYLRWFPAVSRIPGTRRILYSSVAVVSVLSLTVLAGALSLVAVAVSLRRGCRANWLLANGRHAVGTLIATRTYSDEAKNDRYRLFTFRFETEGRQSFEVDGSCIGDPRADLLYDAKSPTRAILLDAVTGRAEVDESGGFKAGETWIVVIVLLVPTIAFAAHAFGAYVSLFVPG